MFIEGLTKEIVIAATNKTAKFYGKRDVDPKLSEKAQKAREIISRNFGCERHNVAKLISCILGEKITIGKNITVDYTKIAPFTAVVLLSNPNDHSYTLNKVLVTFGIGECRLLTPEGKTGNNPPWTSLYAWRLATEEEITQVFKPKKKK